MGGGGRFVVAVAAAALVAGPAVPVLTAHAEPLLSRTPAKKVLILNANVKEGFTDKKRDDIRGPGYSDIYHNRELRNFVERIPKVVNRAPDVILLQEVVKRTAAQTARLLTEKLGFDYRVEIGPSSNSTTVRRIQACSDPRLPRGKMAKETAIIINTDTMQAIGEGGFITTRYVCEDAAPERQKRFEQREGMTFRKHAYLRVKEKASSVEFPVVSVHYVTQHKLRSDRVGYRKKADWTRQITGFLQSNYPSDPADQARAVGGDFNNHRCRRRLETIDCELRPFWKEFAEAGYKDGVFQDHNGSNNQIQRQGLFGAGTSNERQRGRIDFVFSRSRICNAAQDVRYQGKALLRDPDRARRLFYSDHRMMFSLITPAGQTC